MSLFEREYMRNRRAPGKSAMSVLFQIIIINIILFILDYNQFLSLSCQKLSLNTLYQIVTAGFTHASFGHILFNMWGLYLFGKLVAHHVSGKIFWAIYLAGVLVGNGLYLWANYGQARYLLGASGAVCAIIVAAAMFEPDQKFVLLFLPFAPMRTTTMALCYVILDALYLFQQESNIAHLAHLGGFIGGFLVVIIFCHNEINWKPLAKLFRRKPKVVFSDGNHSQDANGGVGTDNDDGGPVKQAEFDSLLDKLSRNGVNSLTPYEYRRLRRAREQMRGER